MRDYGKVASTFWTGATGRLLRADRDSQVVALYLLTGPMANMIGLYHLPVALLADHTGIPLKGASKALRRVCDAGFARFEGVLEHVFIPEMASYQIGEPLLLNDNRVKGIISLWQSYRKSPFYIDFHTRYAQSYHLPTPSPLEAPPKPGAGAGTGTEAGTGLLLATGTTTTTFRKPTLEELEEYCREVGATFSPQQFIDYYTANGWKVGRNAMKDWRAAVRTWKAKEQKPLNGTHKPTVADLSAQMAAKYGAAAKGGAS